MINRRIFSQPYPFLTSDCLTKTDSKQAGIAHRPPVALIARPKLLLHIRPSSTNISVFQSAAIALCVKAFARPDKGWALPPCSWEALAEKSRNNFTDDETYIVGRTAVPTEMFTT
jgi:hypothetical protein